jgi:DNA invertase Pin-like site-specific DNA recombinase
MSEEKKTAILNIERAAPAIDGTAVRIMSRIEPLGLTASKLRVAAYARVSSDSEDQLNSYMSQVKYYTTLITENEDCEYVDVYADEGLTGTEMSKRTQFQRMLNDCRSGKIDKILCKSVSRFARNFTDCLEVIHELKCLGVTVVFDKEGIDTSKMSGETRLAMQASAAQRESMSISGNLRRGVRMKMKTGEFLPSSVPFGYKLNTKLRTFELVPEEAEVVKRIFAEYLSGKGMELIAQRMNDDGIVRESHSPRSNLILGDFSTFGLPTHK